MLTENFGIPHGAACGAFAGHFLDRCRVYSPEKFSDFTGMTDDAETVKKVISGLVDLEGVSISPEDAHRYSARWEKAVPKNFLSSPGGLTREEAEGFLVI